MEHGNTVSFVEKDLPCEWLLFSSEQPHIQGLIYSDSHHVYTNDLSKLSNIPGPRNFKGRKSDILRLEDIVKADNAANSMGQSLNKKPLKHVVEELTKGLSNDLAKTRAVYRWLTLQPVSALERSSSEVDTNTAHYLLQLVENKLTYAQLFSILCGMIGVPCVVISGFAKGSTYEVGEKLTEKHSAEWNAVLINQIWWLVDTFWGACEIVGKSRTEIKYSFDEYYFLTDPEQLIYTHFPEVLEWQLLDRPISLKKFRKQACLRQRFFQLDMKYLADPLCCLQTKDGDVSFVFGLNSQRSKRQTFQCYVKKKEPDKKRKKTDMKKKKLIRFPAANVDVKTVEENDDKYLNIRIRFQEVGIYSVEIVGKEWQVKTTDKEFDWIAIFKVHVKKISRQSSLQDNEINTVASETHEKEKQAQRNLVETNPKTKLVEKAKAEEMKKADILNILRQVIHNALGNKRLDQLELAVGVAIKSGYTAELGVEIAEARQAMDRIKRLQDLMQRVLELNQKTIAEIRSYSNPPEEVYKVMKATLLLLGNYEEETKNWNNVKALISKTGKISLKRRVTEFNIESLQLDVALGSKQILKGIQFETVCVTSSGAAAFFNWATGIISEMERKYANNVSSTIHRTTKS
ncbi:hypothetical protein CHS0354_035754 [Potamilus streckersoni]|uniref:Uncharacterized protein n=1 Tax=Potamilus streckersoni TaxID=2493646 RepID=A0AAE0S0B0_9BIVA|nr:hypothetical protein CHS0354_035754 [Potamilus streckersoni]